jgi:hypothetical protein
MPASEKVLAIELPVPSPMAQYTTGDARKLFEDITKLTPRDNVAERAFLASKMHIARTHPTLSLAARREIADGFAAG